MFGIKKKGGCVGIKERMDFKLLSPRINLVQLLQ
jgi:hypothetical protein